MSYDFANFEFDKDSRGAKAAQALGNAVNGFSADDYRQFAVALCQAEHRTIQQNAFRAIVGALRQWDGEYVARRYDARNEATVTRCAAIMAAEKRGDIPQLDHLPYV